VVATRGGVNAKNLISSLEDHLTTWTFQPYGNDGAIACYPPQIGQPAFDALNKIAVISSVCGPFYVVCNLRTYPETYLHVRECRSGAEWIFPLRGNASLDLCHQIKRWAKQEFCGELKLSGEIMPKLEGDYYGKIMTDGRAPDSVVCWDGGGFYLEANQ